MYNLTQNFYSQFFQQYNENYLILLYIDGTYFR